MLIFFMKSTKYLKYTLLCLILAICQVSIGTFWATYMLQKPSVTDMTGVLGFDFTILLCFSTLNFFWVSLISFFKMICILVVRNIPGYAITNDIFDIKHLIGQIAIGIPMFFIPELLQNFLLRKFYKTQKTDYLYFYFMSASLASAIQIEIAGNIKKKILANAVKYSYFGKNMKLISLSSFRERSTIIERRNNLNIEKKSMNIWSNICYSTFMNFVWIDIMCAKSVKNFLKNKTPIWIYFLLAGSLLISWPRIFPMGEVFFASFAYFFLCYIACKIFVLIKIRLILFLPIMLWIDMSNVDSLYSCLPPEMRLISCAILIFFDRLIHYYWEE